MIKVAIISPLKYLAYSEYGDIDMVLTPMIIGNQKTTAYTNFYEKSKRYKILDNGAYEMEEEGVGCNFYEVIDVANIIHADEIILTDYPYDCGKTIKAVHQCIDILHKRRMMGKFILHAVPQGSNEEEWMNCFDKMALIEEISIIGLSKLSVPKCFGKLHEKNGFVAKSRIRAIEHILKSGKYKVEKSFLRKDGSTGKRIHLLGSDNWAPYELAALNKYSFIRSIDTSMPVWYGLNSKKINPLTGKCNGMLKKVNLHISKNVSPDIEICILHNLLLVHKFSKYQKVVNL